MEQKLWPSRPSPIAVLVLSTSISLVQIDVKESTLSMISARAEEDSSPAEIAAQYEKDAAAAYAPFLAINPDNVEEILLRNVGKTIIVMFSSGGCHPCLDLAREMQKNQSDDHIFVIVHDDADYEKYDRKEIAATKGKWGDVADYFARRLGSPKGMPQGTPFVTCLTYKEGKWSARPLKSIGRYTKRHPAEHWMKSIRAALRK